MSPKGLKISQMDRAIRKLLNIPEILEYRLYIDKKRWKISVLKKWIWSDGQTMGSTEILNTVLESSLVALSAYGYKRGVTIDQGGAKLAKRWKNFKKLIFFDRKHIKSHSMNQCSQFVLPFSCSPIHLWDFKTFLAHVV